MPDSTKKSTNPVGRPRRSIHAARVDGAIGQTIRQYRVALGMSQERLGNLLGVSLQQVQKYESGGNRVSAYMLRELSHVLGAPLHDFFGGSAPLSVPAGSGISTRESVSALALYNGIKSPVVRQRVRELMKAIVGEEKNREE